MRCFIRSAMAVLGLSFGLTQCVTAAPFGEPIGLQLESVSGGMRQNISATLEKVRNWGFSEVELVGDYNLSPGTLRGELSAHRLKALSAHFPYAQFRDHPERIADEASALGLVTVGCPSLPQRDNLDEAGVHAAASVFNRAGEILARRGIQFFYHPHGYEFKPSGKGTLFDLLAEQTDPRYVHFQMDIYWIVHAGQDPVSLLQKYPNRWISMHLKDMRKGTPTGIFNGKVIRRDFVPVGQGQIDVVAAMKAARRLGIKSYFIEDESSSPSAGIPQSLRFLRSVSW